MYRFYGFEKLILMTLGTNHHGVPYGHGNLWCGGPLHHRKIYNGVLRHNRDDDVRVYPPTWLFDDVHGQDHENVEKNRLYGDRGVPNYFPPMRRLIVLRERPANKFQYFILFQNFLYGKISYPNNFRKFLFAVMNLQKLGKIFSDFTLFSPF